MATVLMPLIDGFEETEAVAVVDVLRRAGVAVTTAGIGKRTATGSHNITVQTDAEWDAVVEGAYDAIVLPGGPGTKDLNNVAGLHARLKRQAAGGRLVAAICAAPTILANAGLLEGKRACAFPSVEDKLAGAVVVRDAVVEDGNVITSRGMGTAIEFGLAVAARLVGRDKSEQVARAIVHRA